MTKLILTALLLNAAAAGAAFAGEKCDVPVAQWQPREALQAKLVAKGWQVRSIKNEDGCYEAYAIDANGNKVEAYFDPKTLEPVAALGATDDDSEG
jgi:hypothetical protein